MKQRNHAFDLLCGICIIRMIMLHITQSCGFDQQDWWREVMAWSYFFMSFFFFKAGYFNRTVSGNSWAYCVDRFKRLMVPYLVWGLIGNTIYFFFALFVLDQRNTMVQDISWQHLYTTSQFYGNIPCWFLFSFFIAYVCMHFIGKVRGLRWVVLLFPFISYWLYVQGNPLWLSLNNVFFGIFLFFLGRVWRWLMERMNASSQRHSSFIAHHPSLLVSLLLIGVFVWLNEFHHGEYKMSTNLWDGNVWIILLSTITSLCGISGLLLSLHVPRVPVVNYVGEHSMVFFVAHYPMLILYKMLRSASVHTLRGHWDDYTILIFVLFGFCLLLVPHIEKVAWLSGRFPKKTPSQTT